MSSTAFVGTSIGAGETKRNLNFIKESKDNAKKHEWLFHCTTESSFFSIIKSKEFWLRNLKLVNDDEEVGRIDVPEFENSYYVACFTHENNVPNEHWNEYGNLQDGILFSVKHEWFIHEAVFMLGNHQKDINPFFTIYKSRKEAEKIKIEEQYKNRRVINPFFIAGFDFYQIEYDNTLKTNILENGMLFCSNGDIPIPVLTPEVVGIVKSRSGKCIHRETNQEYIKDWFTEKEVRLKIRIEEYLKNNSFKAYFPYIAVPLKPNAFNELIIRFSPEFGSLKKEACLNRLNEILPSSKIEVL